MQASGGKELTNVLNVESVWLCFGKQGLNWCAVCIFLDFLDSCVHIFNQRDLCFTLKVTKISQYKKVSLLSSRS